MLDGLLVGAWSVGSIGFSSTPIQWATTFCLLGKSSLPVISPSPLEVPSPRALGTFKAPRPSAGPLEASEIYDESERLDVGFQPGFAHGVESESESTDQSVESECTHGVESTSGDQRAEPESA